MKRSAIALAIAACTAIASGLFTTTALADPTAGAPATSAPADPTSGLTRYTDTYYVQHPYNLPQSDRFSITNGVTNAWVYKGDKPFKPGSSTGPRTEMRWNTNFSSGEHLWEADVYIDPGTTGTCVMQVHVNGPGEPIYIQTSNGNLYNSNSALLATNILGHWFHLDAAYDPSNGGLLQIWVNNNLVHSGHYGQPAGTSFYFKNGVYGVQGSKSEAHFKNIELWEGSGGGGGGGSFPGGYHQLVVQNSKLCVDVAGASKVNNAVIDQWACKSTGQANQEFQFNAVSGGYGELQNQNSGLDLVVQGGVTTSGAKVIQYTQNGSTNGLWEPIQASNGSWQFKNERSGLCLDQTGNVSTAGVQFDQWPCRGSANQEFATH